MKPDDALQAVSVEVVNSPPSVFSEYILSYPWNSGTTYAADVLAFVEESPDADLSNLNSEDLWEPFGGELRVEARKHIESFRRSLDQHGR